MLHHIDICFLICICLWPISQIPTCLRVVVGPELVSTLPAFMKSIASHPAGSHGRLLKKRNRAPIAGGGRGQTAVTAPPRVCCVVGTCSSSPSRSTTPQPPFSPLLPASCEEFIRDCSGPEESLSRENHESVVERTKNNH